MGGGTAAESGSMRPHILSAALVAAGLSFAAHGASAQVLVGASFGQFRADQGCANCDRHDTAFRATAGYAATDEVSIEASFMRFGEVRAASSNAGPGTSATPYRVRGLGVLGVAAARFTASFSLIGKVGVVRARADGSSQGGGIERATELAWGVGVGHVLGNDVGARLEWERLRVRLAGEKVIADLVTLAIVYRF
jgi:hypothetical protein